MKYKGSQVIAIGFKKPTKRNKIKKEIRNQMYMPLPDKVSEDTQMIVRINYEIEWR